MSDASFSVAHSTANDAPGVQTSHRPRSREDFEIAIVCALPLEFDAVSLLIDEFYDEAGDQYGRAKGDSNTYVTGRMGNHSVVITLLSGIGKVYAAKSVARLESSYTDLKLILLVGICGALPILNNGDEVLLGDVIISDAVVQYDFGRRYPDSFIGKEASKQSSRYTDSLLATIRTQLGLERLQQRTAYFLGIVQSKADHEKYRYPGSLRDELFMRDYRHRHQDSLSCVCSQWEKASDPVCDRALDSSCAELKCSATVPRRRLNMRSTLEETGSHVDIQQPFVFLGHIASGDTVMKSGTDRDHLAKQLNVIAFEMEGSGISTESPCIVIKGACDYADSHKNKIWQTFAAATAASATKALLERYIQTDRSTSVPRLLTSSEDHWRNVLASSALMNLPDALHQYLTASTSSNSLSTHWKPLVSHFIRHRPNVPVWLSNTSPYKLWTTGSERNICYQVFDSESRSDDAITNEYDDVLLTFLGEFEQTQKKHGNESRIIRPSTLKNLYLFYTLTNRAQVNTGEPYLSPHQAFLWSLIAQALLWRSEYMGLLLGWLGALNPSNPSLQTLPDFEQLCKFFRSLLELNGSPVVVTLCHAEQLTEEDRLPVLQMLSEFCHGTSPIAVPVYMVLSIPEKCSLLPVIEDFQKLSRYTEGNECLDSLKFDGQFLRRDEVSTADEGTNTWIWSHPTYVEWESNTCGILWIEGKAGSGKSVLAKTIQSRLNARRRRSELRGIPLPPVSDWFYSSRHGSTTKSHVAFLRSTLGQLLEQNTGSFQHYAAKYRQMKQDNETWGLEDYENALEILATHGTAAICIIDAMDESESGGETFDLRARVINLISRLTQAPGSQIRFIVLSRYTVDIDQALRSYWKKGDRLYHILLERENMKDVVTIADNGLAAVKKTMDSFDTGEELFEHLSPGFSTSNDEESRVFSRIRGHLIENAKGVILWVKLAIQSLIGRVRSGLYTLQELEADIITLPKDLVDFYRLILRDLTARFAPADLEKSKICLMWVVGVSAIRPLALDELFEAIAIPTHLQPTTVLKQDPIKHSKQRIFAKSWIGFYRQLRMRCGPFLEIIIPSSSKSQSHFHDNTVINPRFTIQLLHRTVKDFLHNPKAAGVLYFAEEDAENLVQQSLRTYVDLVLPVNETEYCPVPAKWSTQMEMTVGAMSEYLNGKVLLEFVLEVVPEAELIPHLMIFENSVHPPLLEQRDQMPWEQSLYSISERYFQHGCDKALTTAIANLLSITSILLLNWPTLLRYGPLTRALASVSTQSSPLQRDNQTALEMVKAFHNRQMSMSWDSGGVGPKGRATVNVPTIKEFREVIGRFDVSHSSKKRSQSQHEDQSDFNYSRPFSLSPAQSKRLKEAQRIRAMQEHVFESLGPFDTPLEVVETESYPAADFEAFLDFSPYIHKDKSNTLTGDTEPDFQLQFNENKTTPLGVRFESDFQLHDDNSNLDFDSTNS